MEGLVSSLLLCHRLATELATLTDNASDFLVPLDTVELANKLSDRLSSILAETRRAKIGDSEALETRISHILTTNARNLY